MFKTEDIIDEITQWIDLNLHKPLSIEDVAAQAGYSRWHLQRVFLQVKKVHIGKYIRENKLKLAAKDLVETNYSIMEISCKYGFCSQQAFTRIFCKKYKSPPMKYRKHHRLITWRDNC